MTHSLNLTLSNLENLGYTSKDIKTLPSDMPEIYYYFEQIKKRYYPDIYIPSKNLIIEVKSNYTLNKALEINELKFETVKKMGFVFQLDIWTENQYKSYIMNK